MFLPIRPVIPIDVQNNFVKEDTNFKRPGPWIGLAAERVRSATSRTATNGGTHKNWIKPIRLLGRGGSNERSDCFEHLFNFWRHDPRSVFALRDRFPNGFIRSARTCCGDVAFPAPL